MKILHTILLVIALVTGVITILSGITIIADYFLEIFVPFKTFLTLCLVFIIHSIIFVISGTILWFIGICKPYNSD